MSKRTNPQKIAVAAGVVIIVVLLSVMYWPKKGNAPEVPVQNATSTVPVTTSTATSSNTATVTNTFGWNRYTSADYGITVDYPKDWIIGSTKPIIVDNFNNTYDPQGAVPAGGAEVDMVSTVTGGSVQDIINTELMYATIASTTMVKVGGISCKEIFYSGTFPGGIGSKNIAVYCSGSEQKLYKIYIVYRTGDAKASQFESTFNQILNTIEFAK